MTLQRETWTHGLGSRVRTLWVLKMLATLSGIAVFFYAYFWVMRHPLSAATVMPVTWIDDLVPFSPESFFLYASLWVYVALGSALAKDGRELAAWVAACFAMTVLGLGIFMALPTKVPDFAIDWSRYPSLELFTAVVLHGQLTALRAPRALLACNGLWCFGIVYSAIATRQHLALDIIAGSVLAGAVSIAYVAAGPMRSHDSRGRESQTQATST